MFLDWLLRTLLGDNGGDAFDWSGLFFFLLSILVFILAFWALAKVHREGRRAVGEVEREGRRWSGEAERWAMRSEEAARMAGRRSGQPPVDRDSEDEL